MATVQCVLGREAYRAETYEDIETDSTIVKLFINNAALYDEGVYDHDVGVEDVIVVLDREEKEKSD